MREYIKARVLLITHHIIATDATLRQMAKHFNVSRCTVHKDLTFRLSKVDPTLAAQVKAILRQHDATKHIRGGEATRLMWQGKATKKWKKSVEKAFADVNV